MSRRCFIAGNWKMNKTVAESVALVRELRGAVSMVRDRVEVAIAPPFTALQAVAKALEDSNIVLAAQNCHFEGSGAFTGEVAAPMLKEVGCSWVILGHLLAIMMWGGFYAWHGVVPSAELGFYFSAVTYATIGYGDIVPPESWRLLAAMEGLTGILMCTWSGGFFFAVVSRMYLPAGGNADGQR